MKPRVALVGSYFPSREEPYRGQSTYQALRHLTVPGVIVEKELSLQFLDAA